MEGRSYWIFDKEFDKKNLTPSTPLPKLYNKIIHKL